MGSYDVFDGAADYYSTLFDGKGIKCPQVDYVTRFSELKENYNPHDEVSVEETKSDVLKNFVKYLREESIDPADLEEFLDGETILKYRNVFQSVRQYKINRKDLLKKLGRQKMFEHWDELMELRINKDFLVKQYIQELREDPLASNILKGITFLTQEKEVPCLIVFLYMKDIILQLSDDDIIECMELFGHYGLPKNVIREFASEALDVLTVIFREEELSDLVDPEIIKERVLNNYIEGGHIEYDTVMDYTDNFNTLSNEQMKKLYTSYTFFNDLSMKEPDSTEFDFVKNALEYASIDEISSGVKATLPKRAKSILDADPRLAAAIYVNGGDPGCSADFLKEFFKENGEVSAIIALYENISVEEIHERLIKELEGHKELLDDLRKVEDVYEKRGIVPAEQSELLFEAFDKFDWIYWFIEGCIEYPDYITI